MTERPASFPAGLDFPSVLPLISRQIYDTPLAFLRENLQNALDAIRIQAFRDGKSSGDLDYRIEILVEGSTVKVADNGIGMSAEDLRQFFWTIGASGKRSEEATAAGCVGTFGIGGFANFGVCDVLEVISQTEIGTQGTSTKLSADDIERAGTSPPTVTALHSDAAAPRGTVVVGHLKHEPSPDELRQYLADFTRYVPTQVFFNGQKLPQADFRAAETAANYEPVTEAATWTRGDVSVTSRFFEDRAHALMARLETLTLGAEAVPLTGTLRFEHGSLGLYKHGFQLCTMQVPSTIGLSGRLDCARFSPTAGRDTLDADTTKLLAQITDVLESAAIELVLQDTDRLAQHTRVFSYLRKHDWIDKLGRSRVGLADGSETTLGALREQSAQGVTVFFGVTQKHALNQVMQARGHLVVLLSSDRHRQRAERDFLERYCSAKPFDGVIECSQIYDDLTRFEKVFLSELELTITRAYEIDQFILTPGQLTEDLPVFVKEAGKGSKLEIIVDVRHSEIAKLEQLGYTSILYALISTFCREYLGSALKSWSPRFFGNGALNLELLSRRRSEIWLLVKDDIEEIRKGGIRQVVTARDVEVVSVGEEETTKYSQGRRRILRIVDETGLTNLRGFYLRMPDSAFDAYGDLLPAYENQGVVWCGNKITYVASDAVSAAFQYEVRLDEIVCVENEGQARTEGAIALERPIYEAFGGIYFPIPAALKRFLVPTGNQEIRLQLFCEWFDIKTARQWRPREGGAYEGGRETAVSGT